MHLYHQSIIGLVSDDASSEKLAEFERFDLPLITDPVESLPKNSFILVVSETEPLSIQATGKSAPGPINADFLTGKNNYRRLHGGGRGQLIAKACGFKPGIVPSVIDLTAGLGEDGFVLASLGSEVTLVERHPIVYALLTDGLSYARKKADDGLSQVLMRMQTVHDNSLSYLKAHDPKPNLVYYLDPMFPPSPKQAKVNKAMSSFKRIVGSDDDAGLVLKSCLNLNPCRIVIKRPRKGACLHEQHPELELSAPNMVYEGKSSRYDVYTLKAMSKHS